MSVGLQGFTAITGSRAPTTFVLNTAKLKGTNLEAVKRNVQASQHLQPLDLPFLTSFPILMDTEASCCTSPSIDDFEPGTIQDLPTVQRMKGIGGDIEIRQIGILNYKSVDDNGAPLTIRCPGFYTPTLETRLFSPQVFLSTGGSGGSYVVQHDRSTIRLKSGQTLTMFLDPSSKLFYAHCFHDVQRQADQLAQALGLAHDSNNNLSRGQKQILRWHHALVHVGFSTIRHVGKLGWLGTKGLALGDPKLDPPLCGSCQYGKGQKRSTKATKAIARPQAEGAITKDSLSPGDLVSMDHMIIRQHGRRLDSMGREALDKMYQAGTIFVDAASGRIKVKFQRGTSASETLQSKMEFEREAISNGVTIKAYRTDNGTFTAQSVIDEIRNSGQDISFSGSGAQHQNGVAERAIKTVCEATRTVMLHSALRWPDAYDPSLGRWRCNTSSTS